MQVHCLVKSNISGLEANGRTEPQAIPSVSACAIALNSKSKYYNIVQFNAFL
jgi:hypothetical protein